jgi:hypothetical protein
MYQFIKRTHGLGIYGVGKESSDISSVFILNKNNKIKFVSQTLIVNNAGFKMVKCNEKIIYLREVIIFLDLTIL